MASCKRGFTKRKDAVAWERTALPALIEELQRDPSGDEKKLFSALVAEYMNDANVRLRQITYCTKKNILVDCIMKLDT